MNLSMYLILFALCVNTLGQAQSSTQLLQSMSSPDSGSGARVQVFHDSAIQQALEKRRVVNVENATSGPGFRIQVFSSNVQRTAKSEAFGIEKEIKATFPNEKVYVTYASPFWRVRVGNFKTQVEANEFRAYLLAAMPTLRKATYVVKDRINY